MKAAELRLPTPRHPEGRLAGAGRWRRRRQGDGRRPIARPDAEPAPDPAQAGGRRLGAGRAATGRGRGRPAAHRCRRHACRDRGRRPPLLRDGLLQSVAGGIAYRAIRNRGTLGGSLAHADPAADWVLTMAALGAQIEIASATGMRRVPMERFMQGAYTTDLADGELLAAVLVPEARSGGPLGVFQVLPQDRRIRRGQLCGGVRSVAQARAHRARGARWRTAGLARALAAQVARDAAMPSRDTLDRRSPRRCRPRTRSIAN